MSTPNPTRRWLVAAAILAAIVGGTITPNVAAAAPTRFTGNPMTEFQKKAAKKGMLAFADAVFRAASADSAFTGKPVSIETLRSAVGLFNLPADYVVKFSKTAMTITSKKYKTTRVTITVAKNGKVTIR